jgi:toxin ParE1/3/4
MRLAIAAQADYHDILNWTAEQFGKAQAETYSNAIDEAVAALSAGPRTLGVRSRKDIGHGLRSLHIARGRRKGRHLLFFRADSRQNESIEILRILQDSMDIARHLPSATDE